MLRLVIEVAPHEADAASGLLFEAGATGIQQEDHPTRTLLMVYGEEPELVAIERALQRAKERGLTLACRREPVDDSWKERWVNAVETHWLTDDLVMLPRGQPRPDGAQTVLSFEPGWAFGTGGHVTTRLAAECLKACVKERPKARLLDVGTGSGTLALAGLLWGAHQALGIDNDPRAIQVAEDNARLNGLSERARFSDTPLEAIRERFDLVVANIDQPTLLDLAPFLARATDARGELIVTGLLEEYSGELVAAFSEQGLEVCERQERDEWSLLRLRHALWKTRKS